ncbi:MAG: undecaprenyl-diphosphatase [Anaerofustis stercorihominis]|nr:undecaprenyl-diphosphatase [Anaerofustis stercorihominis]
MSITEAFILGAVQGATEFLPVSSSGHLAITSALLGVENTSLAFTIILHLGTLLAIVIAYKESVFNLIRSFFMMVGDVFRGKGFGFKEDKYRWYIVLLIVASIPAGIVGVFFGDVIDALFSSVYFVIITLSVTGVILIVGERIGAKAANKNIEDLSPVQAFGVGLFQMCAVLPGISRSGTTTVGGLTFGLKKDEALELSFLMALPAILGSLLLDIKDIIGTVMDLSVSVVGVGFVTSLVVGYFSINFFKKVVKKGSMAIFSIYLWVLSFMLLIIL